MYLDVLRGCIERFRDGYAELRHHRRETFRASIKDGKIESITDGVVEGTCARVLVDGSWGFASTTNSEPRGVEEILRGAYSLARASRSKKRRHVRLASLKPYVGRYETPMKRDPKNSDRGELIELLLDVDRMVRGYSKAVVSENIGFNIVDDEVIFLSSEGAEISQRIVRCFGGVTVVAREGGQISSAIESIGSQSGLEVLEEAPLMEAGMMAAERACRLVSSRVAPAGVYPVILENKIVGLLAHEAVGHCSEADLVYGGSFLADKVGVRVASEKITLIDDGLYPNGFGSMRYDDEGVPTQRTVIIEQGVCRGFLHSRETAQEFGVAPTGNARAWSFEYDPIIRMRNTYIEPGDWSLEELAEDIGEGYFLKGGLSGQADFHGEFMFGTQEAVRIRNGEFGESLRGVTISGNAFEVLGYVDAVGRDFAMRIGMCGKEQVNYVGMGGPSLRMRLLLGGAR